MLSGAPACTWEWCNSHHTLQHLEEFAKRPMTTSVMP